VFLAADISVPNADISVPSSRH